MGDVGLLQGFASIYVDQLDPFVALVASAPSGSVVA